MAKKSKDMSIEDLINEEKGRGRDLFKNQSYDQILRGLGLNFGQRMAQRKATKRKMVTKRNERKVDEGMKWFSSGNFAKLFKPKK